MMLLSAVHVFGFSVLAAAVILLALVLAASLAPHGRRIALTVPLIFFAAVILIAAVAGRNQLGKDRNAEKLAADKSFAEHCLLAKTLVDSNLIDAGARELEAALTSPHSATSDATCAAVAARLAALPTQASTRISVSTSASGSPASSDSAAIASAVQTGTERGAKVFLDRLVGGTKTGKTVTLTLGPLGWLAVGLMALLIVVLWTRLVFFLKGRANTPFVRLAPVIDGSGKTEPVAGVAASLRRELFKRELKSPSVPAGTATDVGAIIEASEISGAKFLSAVLKLVQAVFGSENIMSVTCTVTSMDEGAWIALIEMTDRRGNTLDIQPIKGENSEDLLQKIAVQVKNQALRRDNVALPPWQEWTPEALSLYLKGVKHETEALESVGAPA